MITHHNDLTMLKLRVAKYGGNNIEMMIRTVLVSVVN